MPKGRVLHRRNWERQNGESVSPAGLHHLCSLNHDQLSLNHNQRSLNHDQRSLNQEIVGEEAEQLVSMCPKDVFDIEEIGNVKTAKVSRPRDCTICRECLRLPGWEEKVRHSVNIQGTFSEHSVTIQ
jgi:NAD-dependent dihydropyrimidine dehydrogenase PreA subunit